MGMHHLGHVYIPMLTAYQFMHAPLDLYAMQWKLGPGGGVPCISSPHCLPLSKPCLQG